MNDAWRGRRLRKKTVIDTNVGHDLQLLHGCRHLMAINFMTAGFNVVSKGRRSFEFS